MLKVSNLRSMIPLLEIKITMIKSMIELETWRNFRSFGVLL